MKGTIFVTQPRQPMRKLWHVIRELAVDLFLMHKEWLSGTSSASLPVSPRAIEADQAHDAYRALGGRDELDKAGQEEMHHLEALKGHPLSLDEKDRLIMEQGMKALRDSGALAYADPHWVELVQKEIHRGRQEQWPQK